MQPPTNSSVRITLRDAHGLSAHYKQVPEKGCEASRTLPEVAGEFRWMAERLPVPQNLSSFILLLQVWKNDSFYVCVCVCVWCGGKWTRGWGLIAKVNGVVVKKLEMLFTCLSITNPNKLTSQIKQSMAAPPDRFGNPKISTVFPTELCCSVCSHQVQTARFWEQVPCGWT